MVGRGAVDQLQQVHGLPALPGEPVPAGHAVAQVGQIGPLQTLVRHLLRHFPVGVLGQAAVAAAGSLVALIRRLRHGAAQAFGDPADGLLCLVDAPRAAGIVDGDAFLQPLRFFRQADALQNLPDTDRLVTAQLLFTGGTSGDHDGISQFFQFFVQEADGILIHLIPARPVADRAAAAQHQRHAALQTIAQVQVSGPHGRRGNGGGLTAGEEDIFTLLKARLGFT